MEQYSHVRVLIILILAMYAPHIDTSKSSIGPNKLISYSIPDKRQLKQALRFDEDIYLNFTELTSKYKYRTEVHSVITEDGYQLGVFRMLPKCSGLTKSYPVLLLHGIFDTSDMWIIPDTKIGLGYVLADNCYDVWAANSRGNHYSRRHVTLNPDVDPEYWEYSFEEIGSYDLPAIIDYVLQQTGYSKLFFIGHSQGTTGYLTMASLRPEYNDKVVLAMLLGPVAWLTNLVNPLAVLAANNYKPIKHILETVGLRELFARDHITHHITEFLCAKLPKLCELGFTLSTGHKQGTISTKTISIAVGHLFSGSSVKTISHFAQLIVSKKFQRFDEGTVGNRYRYGSSKAPQYNIDLVTSPIVLFSAKNDALSPVQDVNILVSKLPNLIENYVVPRSYWSHHNHIWSSEAPDLVYSRILRYLKQFG